MSRAAKPRAATYVLIPGMWHGGWCFDALANLLRHAGHAVFAPTLTGLADDYRLTAGTRIDLDTHAEDLVALLRNEDLHGVHLLGHSYGGAVMLCAADREPGRIARLIALDALLPAHGQTLAAHASDLYERFAAEAQPHPADKTGPLIDADWVHPPADWSFGLQDAQQRAWLHARLRPHPLATWRTPVRWQDPAALALPRTYIDCSSRRSNKAIDAEEREWRRKGWDFRHLRTGHDAMLSEPTELAALLEDVSHARVPMHAA